MLAVVSKSTEQTICSALQETGPRGRPERPGPAGSAGSRRVWDILVREVTSCACGGLMDTPAGSSKWVLRCGMARIDGVDQWPHYRQGGILLKLSHLARSTHNKSATKVYAYASI